MYWDVIQGGPQISVKYSLTGAPALFNSLVSTLLSEMYCIYLSFHLTPGPTKSHKECEKCLRSRMRCWPPATCQGREVGVEVGREEIAKKVLGQEERVESEIKKKRALLSRGFFDRFV